MNRVFFLLSIFAIGLGIMTVLTILFWLTYPYKPLVFNDSVFPIKNKIVRQGGTLTYVSDYCKNTNLSAVITRTFTNGLVFIVPAVTSYRPVGCQVINVVVSIPVELPPGKYFLQNLYSYQVNPLRTVVVAHNTEEFEVVEADPDSIGTDAQ